MPVCLMVSKAPPVSPAGDQGLHFIDKRRQGCRLPGGQGDAAQGPKGLLNGFRGYQVLLVQDPDGWDVMKIEIG